MILEVVDASFAYPSGKVLFEHLGYELEEGTILTVLGRNGVGKTTLLKCMMGILPWRTGTLKVNGEDVKNAIHTKGIAYVPQAHNITFSYSVRDVVTMGRARYMSALSIPSKHDYERADEALETVGLSDYAHRTCGQLSGGQLQMVYIARALAADPEVLIMDEPESHLDFYNQFYVLELVRQLVEERGISAIINTHYPDHAMLLSGKTMMMRPGEYIFGDTGEILTPENVHRFFDVHAVIETLERDNCTVPVFAVTGRHESMEVSK